MDILQKYLLVDIPYKSIRVAYFACGIGLGSAILLRLKLVHYNKYHPDDKAALNCELPVSNAPTWRAF